MELIYLLINFTSSNNQKKHNNWSKNKKQELPENWTVGKSDNQGVKEETSIQTGRRGGDGQLGQRGRAARWWMMVRTVPPSRADKNQEQAEP